ncbi:YxiJ family protein [Metabacillus sp. 84]|uniref:YxiJ family protein n=1 Tax=Metabacillus sp. 84 TaxID=3404705 RepID=UPI003CEEA4B2
MKHLDQFNQLQNLYTKEIINIIPHAVDNNKMPKNQRNLLNKDFFSLYPHNDLLKISINNYPDFKRELEGYEIVRKLMLGIV